MLSRAVHLTLGLLVLSCSGGQGTDTPVGTASPTQTPDTPQPTTATPPTPTPTPTPCALCGVGLRINEVVADNEGVWVDEHGETDDLFELVNTADSPVDLEGWSVSDDPDERQPLPSVVLGAGKTLLLWADDEPEQGPMHMQFKLSAGGETVYLWDPAGTLVDAFVFPALEPNSSCQRFPDGEGVGQVCAFASPGRSNGELCGPPPPTDVPDDTAFLPYEWPPIWPTPASPLALNEIALRPASFVEIVNTSSQDIDLQSYSVRIAAHLPGQPWPGPASGAGIALPAMTLPAGGHVQVSVGQGAVAAVSESPDFQGVVTLFTEAGATVDRLDFMAWPEGATLARQPDTTGSFVFCATSSPGAANASCDPLPKREVPGHLRHLFTQGDFEALAYGDPKLGVDVVKSIQDVENGGQIYLLSSQRWDLHYTFVREVIDGQPHLDRCDPAQAQQFNQGWYAFSVTNYYTTEGRDYYLGTLARYGANDLQTLEFSTGDVITGHMMRDGFFALSSSLLQPSAWTLRAQDDRQITELKTVEGTVPVVGPNAPYAGMTYQPLNEGTTYGTLRYIPAAQLADTTLGSQIIVLTDTVPLDIDLVAGLITESFQTPLAHVAILSRNRGTPNMGLVDGRNHPNLKPYLDTLVRLDVRSGGFEVRPATSEEAIAFWESRGDSEPQVPDLDATRRGLVQLTDASYADLPSIGAKAALMSELVHMSTDPSEGDAPIHVPDAPFAVPVSYYLDHFQASGAAAYLASQLTDPSFVAEPSVRRERLLVLQGLILDHAVEPAFMALLEAHLEQTFGEQRMRFRSSSNTEDLQGFSGAGLYTSVSGALGDKDRRIDDALRTVWASLWNPRAFEERAYFGVDQTAVAMGVLVHPAFLSEEANGVGISRNVLDPERGSTYYLNVQRGEAAVTNPAPGVSSDELLYRWGLTPQEQYLALSSFMAGQPVLSTAEDDLVAQTLRDIHDRFRLFLDPGHDNAFFAVDIEFKFVGDGAGGRELVVKQARPYSFGSAAVDPCAAP